MYDFISLVRKRRSIRRYMTDPVPAEMIKACIEAARFAPTACNTQAWRFIIVEGELKERLADKSLGGIVVPNRWASNAPVFVVIATDLDFITHRLGGSIKGIGYHMIDAGIAGEHFILQATELGLGTCWIGWFNKKAVSKVLELPANWEVTAMITVGFPGEAPPDKRRKSLDEISIFKR